MKGKKGAETELKARSALFAGVHTGFRLPQRATLLLSLIYLQVLLGVIQLLLGFSSHDFAWRRMQRNSLTADHPVFASSALTEIRPGRKVMLLDLTSPPAAVASEGSSRLPPDDRWTVFFMHGSMATMQQFEAQIADLHGGGNCRIVAYDVYGCGASPRPYDFGAYSQENSMLDLIAVFDRYKGTKNLLVGHSYGASQVVRLALARREDVHGAVLIGAGFAPHHFPAKAIKVFSMPLVALMVIRPLLSKGFAERAFHKETLRGACEAHKRVLKRAEAFSGTNSMHVCQAFYQQMSWVTKADLEAMACPVLQIVGQGDRVTPVDFNHAIRDILQANAAANPARWVTYKEIPNASHQVMQEKADDVCLFVADFLRQLEAAYRLEHSLPGVGADSD